VRVADLPSPPRRIRDGQPDLSDLHGIRTHAGVLVFDATITRSGSVTSVRLVSDGPTRAPWPTLIGRCRAAISDWRYQPVMVNNLPVSVCMTVTVIIDLQ
jgi:hypothetical protein